MSQPIGTGVTALPPAARAFYNLQGVDVLTPGGHSGTKRSGALFLIVMALLTAPLFLAANAAGLIGDLPAAVAHGSSNSGSGSGDDGDSSGPGDGDDDGDDSTALGTDETSANNQSTVGTTQDNDTKTKMGTDDTSHGTETGGTTKDNDTNTSTGPNTGTNG